MAAPSLLGPGIHYLTVAAQDRGIGGVYPLRSASKSVTITVLSNNQPPTFASPAISLPATEDLPLAASLAATDPDAGDLLTFTRLAGPGWLSVSSDGVLSGVPGNAQVGDNVFTVRVTDPEGAFDDAHHRPIMTAPAGSPQRGRRAVAHHSSGGRFRNTVRVPSSHCRVSARKYGSPASNRRRIATRRLSRS